MTAESAIHLLKRAGPAARAVLDGLQWPEDAAVAAAAQAWLLRHRGRGLTLVARGETDRWGRTRAAELAGGVA